jgi:addiction module RelE/StbE family toxin
MKLKWSPDALKDLADIKRVISYRRPTASNQIIKKIKKSTNLLSEQRLMGPPGRIEGTREWVISGLPYVVPYTIHNNRVIILRVLHSAIDWDLDDLNE